MNELFQSNIFDLNITMTTLQQQYISEWHDNFANHIGGLLSFVEILLIHPNVTDKDKQALDEIKMILNGKDAKDIEQTLAKGIVKQDTLDKIEKLYKDLTDKAIEKMTVSPLAKVFLKKLSYSQIEQDKLVASHKLLELQIPTQ